MSNNAINDANVIRLLDRSEILLKRSSILNYESEVWHERFNILEELSLEAISEAKILRKVNLYHNSNRVIKE